MEDARWAEEGLLCVITARSLLVPTRYREIVEMVVEARPSMIQIREKNQEGYPTVSDRVFYEDARWLRARCREKKILCIVDDRLDIAMAIDADGVHLGQKDLPLSVARQIWNRKKFYGVSVGTVSEALMAEREGARYLGYGAVFPTGTKRDIRANSLEGLELVCHAVRIPVLAIGGIGVPQVPLAMARGCQGVAVVSAVWKAPDPGRMVRTLYDLVRQGKQNKRPGDTRPDEGKPPKV
ncbi:MAG: thiamine phosphate synthase [Treponemataceae bacterium]|nr:thiamine phosphate synthase [Treponemataceae bacterium]